MGKSRIKKFAGDLLFKKANKSFEKKKKEIVSYIEEEKKKNEKTLPDIIDTIAEDHREDAYWVWLMYILDMKIDVDQKNYEDPTFSGVCTGCDDVFTFTERDKESDDVKCEECGQTYHLEDMLMRYG